MSYCSTKNLYYHGLKLHMVGYRRKGHLPHPCQIALSPASENDLKVFQSECMPDLFNKKIFADKIYRSNDYWEQERRDKANEFYAPVKSIKGDHEEEKQRSKAADDIYSQAVSSVREPIEALFSWLNEKTNIQRASKCSSTCGLLIHTMGKVAIAFLYLIFNYWFKWYIKIHSLDIATSAEEVKRMYAQGKRWIATSGDLQLSPDLWPEEKESSADKEAGSL